MWDKTTNFKDAINAVQRGHKQYRLGMTAIKAAFQQNQFSVYLF